MSVSLMTPTVTACKTEAILWCAGEGSTMFRSPISCGNTLLCLIDLASVPACPQRGAKLTATTVTSMSEVCRIGDTYFLKYFMHFLYRQ